jgi:hypothetical protein
MNEEINKIEKILSDNYNLNKYQNLKKLKGIEFNERMKLEFALRDPQNIEAIEYLTIVYNKKKKNNELISEQLFQELLKEAENINFFSLNISDIEFYKHELISSDLFEIFEYLIKTKIENNKQNRTNYLYRKIDDNIFEEIHNEHDHHFYVNKAIGEFEIAKSYVCNSEDFYIKYQCMPGNLEKEIEKSSEKYYQNTNIKLKSNSIFVNNINLEINLAMPEIELIDYIKKLSKLYKNGKITKKMIQEETFESVFSVVGIKYLTNPEEFLKLLFIYDMHHNTDINNNGDKLFKSIGIKLSTNTIEDTSEKSELSIQTLKDLSGKFKKTLENQLYLQL